MTERGLIILGMWITVASLIQVNTFLGVIAGFFVGIISLSVLQ